jgi:hypothetical protein
MSRDVKLDAHLGVSTGSYAGRIEVLGGPTGRRQRSDAEKARIAAESLAPDAVVAMATASDGEVGTAIHLTNNASKGKGGGRVIPLNIDLRAAFLSLRQSPSRGRPSPFVVMTEPDYLDLPAGDRQPALPLVSRPRLLRMLQPQRATNLHHQRRSKDLERRRIAAGHPNARRPLEPIDDPALHRVACRGAAEDRGVGLGQRSLSAGAMTNPSGEIE